MQRGGQARAPRHVEHVHQRLALVLPRAADVARAAQVLLSEVRLRSYAEHGPVGGVEQLRGLPVHEGHDGDGDPGGEGEEVEGEAGRVSAVTVLRLERGRRQPGYHCHHYCTSLIKVDFYWKGIRLLATFVSN